MKRNSDGVYPLFYAINSFCVENLKTIMKTFVKDIYDEVRYLTIVNDKLENGNNYLHFLINNLTEENFFNVSEMIKVMLVNQCNPNLLNDESETPFYILLRKMQTIKVKNNLIEFFLLRSDLDIQSRSVEIHEMLDKLNLQYKPSNTVQEPAVYLTQLLEQWNEKKFLEEFNNFKKLSESKNSFGRDVSKFLELAVSRNMSAVVKLLLPLEACNTKGNEDSKFGMAPAFLACFFGHHQVLQVLLEDQTLAFSCERTKCNLLHQICQAERVNEKDRWKCFNMIIAEERCTLQIINGLDENSNVPLFYACEKSLDEISKTLLRRGAYIGHEKIVNIMSEEVLSRFLDESVKSSGSSTQTNFEVHIDYKFLMAPNVDERKHLEAHSASLISSSSKLQHLLLHPVFHSFIHLKWKRINLIVYLNLLLYFSFMMFLGAFIINQYSTSIKRSVCVKLPTQETNQTFKDNLVKNYWSLLEDNKAILLHPDASYDELYGFIQLYSYSSNENTILLNETFIPKVNLTAKPSKCPGIETKTSVCILYKEYIAANKVKYTICIIGVLLMTIYEIFQCFK